MFKTKDGEEIFIIDGHVHFWDGSPAKPEECARQAIHRLLLCLSFESQPKRVAVAEGKIRKIRRRAMHDDLFVHGYDDMAILQSTYLSDFYKNGFNTTERNYAMKKNYPDRFIVNGAFDPRDGEAGPRPAARRCGDIQIKGVKLYTAEWKGDCKGYKLTDPASYRFLEEAEKLGIKNIHVHKGPTILPLEPGRLRCRRCR